MQSHEIRERFLRFFASRGHAIVPSASLVPEGDASTLFTTAGMQQFVPYLLGQKHPKGTRLASVQKCLRTGDINEVGDSTHLTFFEMLGNWSLGDYWKEEAIAWSYEFLTNKEEGLGLDPARLYITVFGGHGDSSTAETSIPRDDESKQIWMKQGIPERRIYYRGMDDNFWSPGDNGPCGPSSEMFYDLTEEGLGDLTPEEFEQADEEQEVVEIWNDVFMAYEKKNGEVIGELKQKNVDTGMGLERMTAVMQGVTSPYETDLFQSILEVLPKGDTSTLLSTSKAGRVIVDHIRAAVFAIADGVEPSNTDRGYIIRRLIRRAARYAQELGGQEILMDVITSVVANYKSVYPEINNPYIREVIEAEIAQFQKTLARGIQAFEKGERDAFVLFTTYGFPLELTLELAREHGEEIDVAQFEEKTREHQAKSKTAAAGKFKGGLADSSEETIKLHTAHHLLLAALQRVLGDEVKQRGSNITPERLRIDFTFDRKLTNEEKEQVEDLVNEWIAQDLAVVRREMPREQAEKIGAEMEFGAKYPGTVSVYFIEDRKGNSISKEFCGGPHIDRTSELSVFKIKKEEASSKGVRRIKATLE